MEKQTQLQIRSPYNNLRNLLQRELLNRCQKNSQYSLRAFARSLKLEPSALSKILHGKRNISKNMFGYLSQKLELSPDSQMKLLNIDESSALNMDPQFQKYQNLALDTFNVISDWYHYAILEMTRIEGFKSDPKWIAKTLGITVSEAKIAIARMLKLGFLEVDENGQWKDSSGNLTTVGNEFTAIAFRKLQKQILEKAITAMDEVPMEFRSQTSVTMAVDSDLLPEALKEIKKFRRNMARILESSNRLNQVYNLSISFYPILQKPQKNMKRSNK